jgi:hypothetical protein
LTLRAQSAVTTREKQMNRVRHNPMLHKLRLVAGCALIGSVIAGVFFGWHDFSFDPRAVGASLGAAAGAVKVFHLF